MSAHSAISHPPPPWLQLGFQSTYKPHPKPSQIGVDFSDFSSIGVGLRALPSASFAPSAVGGVVGFSWLIASCQLLAACFQRPSTVQLFALERIPKFTICSPLCQA